MSSKQEFEIEAIEVWLVKEKERDDRLIDKRKLKQGTIMSRMGIYLFIYYYYFLYIYFLYFYSFIYLLLNNLLIYSIILFFLFNKL